MGILDRLLGPPGKSKFAQMFIAALKKAGDTRDVRFDKGHFRLVFEKDGQQNGVLNLSNLYLEYCAVEKPGRDKRLKDMVRAALSHLKEMPDDFEDASHDILPRLWTRGTFERLKLNQLKDGGKPIDWPLESVGEHLYLSLVYDLPESVRSISNQELEDWGVTFWEAREVALQNLYETEFAYTSVGDELYVSGTGDSYDATRLILSGLFDELEVEGSPVAMVPNRDTLVVTGSRSIVGLKMMLEFSGQQLRDKPRPMTATPMILGPEDTWDDWEVPMNHELYDEFRKLKITWLASEYNDQKQLLDRINRQQNSPTVISSCFVGEKSGRTESFCIWPRSEPLLIPETERVLFARDGNHDVFATVPLSTVRLHHPELLEPVESYPTLLRAYRQPTVNELSEMGAELLED
ncbi:MAG: DUF1444 family protein [Planctomycetota bacterium]